MKLEDLFPEAPQPCRFCARTDPHKHVLDHQRRLIESDAKYIAILGGYGSAKTLGIAALGVGLSLAVPGNAGIVCRRSYAKLHDSTERIFLETLQRAGTEFKARELRDGWPHRIILPNASEIVFRETKDLGRFLGPEYGWFVVDEAVEEPRKTFTDLTGRLRLGRAQHFLKGVIASNPPNIHHWIPDVFGRTPGRRGVTIEGETSTYELIQVSTRENPFLPPGYVADLIANHPPSEVKRIVEGHYGFSYEGKPVYAPPFRYETHVGVPETLPYTLVRSWDFGYHCPAVTWHQFPRCKAGRSHWMIVGEFVGQNLEYNQLADVVFEQTRRDFPDHSENLVLDCGDIAGRQVSDKGPGPMVRLASPPWSLSFRYKRCNLEPGLALIRATLKAVCACGQPVLIVHRRCSTLIDALAGGYHYSQDRPGKAMNDKPVKDGYYDNVADSARYAGECFYREAMLDPELLREASRSTYIEPVTDTPAWAWMGGHATPEQITAEINRVLRKV